MQFNLMWDSLDTLQPARRHSREDALLSGKNKAYKAQHITLLGFAVVWIQRRLKNGVIPAKVGIHQEKPDNLHGLPPVILA